MATQINLIDFISGPMLWFADRTKTLEDAQGNSEGLKRYLLGEERAIGVVDDAVRVRRTMSAEPIVADITGGSTLDYVYRGGDVFVDMVMNEFANGVVQSVLRPFAFSSDQSFLNMGALGNTCVVPVGDLNDSGDFVAYNDEAAYSLWGVCVNYHNLGTGMPLKRGGILFRRAIMAPDMVTSIMHGSRLKNVPFTFQCLPYIDGARDYRNVIYGEELDLFSSAYLTD